MKMRWIPMLLVLACLTMLENVAMGAPPWASLIPFKRVEADPDKSYRLTEEQGPWMILASTFAGDGAEQQAHDLVLELRQEYRLTAYVHKRHYDYTEPVEGLGLNRYGGVKKMKYEHAAEFDQYAVLVGDFESYEDPSIEKMLQKIKYARPDCLKVTPGKTNQRLAVFREIQKRIHGNSEARQRGPMGKAFVTRNPLLPKEFFTGGDLDPLVIEMNSDLEYGLLDNPGRYSVRIATFRGAVTMDLNEIERLQRGGQMKSKLEQAAIKAHRMTEALRRQNIEAYEFHDRYESIVTIGSFQSLGEKLPDGRLELHPPVFAIIERYKARQLELPGQMGAGLQPVRIDGIACDVQPVPVLVPKQSIGAAYATGNRGLLR